MDVRVKSAIFISSAGRGELQKVERVGLQGSIPNSENLINFNTIQMIADRNVFS